MSHTLFNHSPGYAPDNLNDLMFGDHDGDVDMAASVIYSARLFFEAAETRAQYVTELAANVYF